MSDDRLAEAGPIANRYGHEAARAWERLLAYHEIAPGFGLLILVVPDSDGAALCRDDLTRLLTERGLKLSLIQPETPVALAAVGVTLPGMAISPEQGGVWLASVTQVADRDHALWERAWRTLLAGLNQQRNPLRERMRLPLTIVCAPWVVSLFRESAPDLWSVRTLVTRIEPDPSTRRNVASEPLSQERQFAHVPGSGADPDLALREAARLRGVVGKENDLANLLRRAGEGLAARGDLARAEAVLLEAKDILMTAGSGVSTGETIHQLARTVRDQGRAAEAEALFRQALAFKEEGGATAVSRGITMDSLGRAVRDQGRAAEAEALFRQALAVREEGGGTAVSRGITTDMLSRAVLDQGRAAEAEALFRQALALKEEGGGTAVSRGITMDNLARAVRDQGRAAEAEVLFRQALALAEEGGDTAVSRGITMDNLARAVRDQGRAVEAEALFRQALALAEEGGDTAVSRGITTRELARTVLGQGRAAEAEALFRQALALTKEGGTDLSDGD